MNKKANVIFILADDMGYGDLSTFNDGLTNTPSLDQLVAQGVILTNCHASSPVCAPSRASIFTGRYPQRTGVIDTLEARGLDRLKLDETTMADMFKQNGYKTGLIGKWHLGAIDDSYHPLNRGFDYFCGFRGGWNYYYDYKYERNWDYCTSDGTYMTDLFTQEAVDFIEENQNNPFFLHLAYNAPHFPLEAPEEIVEKYRELGDYSEAVCKLYAMLECMDSGIGRIMERLDSLGIAENTLLIFSSDNGPDFGGEGEESLKRFNANLRGEKMLVYEGGLKVPAILSWPGRFDTGIQSDEFVHGIDWMPTIQSLLNLTFSSKKPYDGIDFSPIFKGEELPERNLYWQWNRFKPNLNCNAAVTDTNYKLVHPPVREYLDLSDEEVDLDIDLKNNPHKYKDVVDLPLPDLPELEEPIPQLFKLDADKEETIDISNKHPDRVQMMEQDLRRWFLEVERERVEKGGFDAT